MPSPWTNASRDITGKASGKLSPLPFRKESQHMADKRGKQLQTETQHAPEIAVIVGPGAKVRGDIDGFGVLQRGTVEEARARRHQHPARSAYALVRVGCVEDGARLLAAFARGNGDDGREVDISVGDVHREHAIGLQMAPIERDR